MNEKLKEKVKESLSSVLPITLIVLVLSVTLVPMEIGTLALFLTGAVLLIVGSIGLGCNQTAIVEAATNEEVTLTTGLAAVSLIFY